MKEAEQSRDRKRSHSRADDKPSSRSKDTAGASSSKDERQQQDDSKPRKRAAIVWNVDRPNGENSKDAPKPSASQDVKDSKRVSSSSKPKEASGSKQTDRKDKEREKERDTRGKDRDRDREREKDREQRDKEREKDARDGEREREKDREEREREQRESQRERERERDRQQREREREDHEREREREREDRERQREREREDHERERQREREREHRERERRDRHHDRDDRADRGGSSRRPAELPHPSSRDRDEAAGLPSRDHRDRDTGPRGNYTGPGAAGGSSRDAAGSKGAAGGGGGGGSDMPPGYNRSKADRPGGKDVKPLDAEQLKARTRLAARVKQALGGMTVSEALAGPDASASLTSLLNTGQDTDQGIAKPKARVSDRLAVLYNGSLHNMCMAPALMPQHDALPAAQPPPAVATAAEQSLPTHMKILKMTATRLHALQQLPCSRHYKGSWALMDNIQTSTML